MATNEYIQSVLAKAISDVGYIHALEGSGGKVEGSMGGAAGSADENAALIAPLSEDRLHYDLGGIVRFSAFISKVQHNFLWYDYRISFSLLHRHSLEIAVFTAYLPYYQAYKKEKGLDRNEKIDRFIAFLQTFLSAGKGRKYELIRCAVRHEDSLRKLAAQKRQSEERLAQDKRMEGVSISPTSVVRINGWYHIHHFAVAPDELARSAARGQRVAFARRKGIYLYWISAGDSGAGKTKSGEAVNGGVEIIAITKEIETFLRCVDDTSTVTQILQANERTMGIPLASEILLLLSEQKVILLN